MILAAANPVLVLTPMYKLVKGSFVERFCCAELVAERQGQRTLSVLPRKELHHVVHVPASHSSLHDVAFLAGMLLD